MLGYLKTTTVSELLSKLKADGSLECSSSELMSKLLQHGYEIDELPQLFEHFNQLGFNVDNKESKQNQVEVVKEMEVVKDGLKSLSTSVTDECPSAGSDGRRSGCPIKNAWLGALRCNLTKKKTGGSNGWSQWTKIPASRTLSPQSRFVTMCVHPYIRLKPA